jgi:hypothetical protein
MARGQWISLPVLTTSEQPVAGQYERARVQAQLDAVRKSIAVGAEPKEAKYDQELITLAMDMLAKSPAAYEVLRRSGVVKMPHPATVLARRGCWLYLSSRLSCGLVGGTARTISAERGSDKLN